MFDRLIPFWLMQHQAILNACAQEQNKVLHRLNKQYLDCVQGLVYDQALLLIVQEQAKLHKVEDAANLD
jgi:hypothetical protein